MDAKVKDFFNFKVNCPSNGAFHCECYYAIMRDDDGKLIHRQCCYCDAEPE